jgi:hypothetical protein
MLLPGLILTMAASLTMAQSPAPSDGGSSYDEVGLDQKISPKLLEWFRAGVPKDAMGLAIVQGQVVSVRTSRYCPMGTPLCGLVPTCAHAEKGWATSAKLKVNFSIIRRQKPVIPATIEDYVNPPGIANVRAGDTVWIGYHTLSTNQQPRIGLIEKVRPATNAPPAAPK